MRNRLYVYIAVLCFWANPTWAQNYWDASSMTRFEQMEYIKADIEKLIEVIGKHDENYNVFTNNCKDFAKQILDTMKSNA